MGDDRIRLRVHRSVEAGELVTARLRLKALRYRIKRFKGDVPRRRRILAREAVACGKKGAK